MKNFHSVEEYIEEHSNFSDSLTILRDIINSTTMVETIKWNMPVYAFKGKNVLSLGAFKNHFCIWFFKGIFLIDEENRLVNAQEKTKGMRQMRFETIHDIDNSLVLAYVKEAINNQKLGKELKPTKTTKKDVNIPDELQKELDSTSVLHDAFKLLTPSKQREYCDYIDTAKRDVTKQTRLKKIKPMIMKNIGLNATYK